MNQNQDSLGITIDTALLLRSGTVFGPGRQMPGLNALPNPGREVATSVGGNRKLPGMGGGASSSVSLCAAWACQNKPN